MKRRRRNEFIREPLPFNRNPFDSLPNEIVAYILELAYENSFNLIPYVCQRWYVIINEVVVPRCLKRMFLQFRKQCAEEDEREDITESDESLCQCQRLS